MTRTFLVTLLLFALLTPAVPQIKIVNMIPFSRSDETEQDSEPAVAVRPSDTRHIAATAVTWGDLMIAAAPLYYSMDGGNTWGLSAVLPGITKPAGPNPLYPPYPILDATVAWNGTGSSLYAAALKTVVNPLTGGFSRPMAILQTGTFPPVVALTELNSREFVDQANVVAATPSNAPDRVFVGNDDQDSPMANQGRTATVDVSTAAVPSVTRVLVEDVDTMAGDRAPVQVAVHPNANRVYAVFYRRAQASPTTAPVVVVRDDTGATVPAKAFFALMTGAARGVTIATADLPDPLVLLGQQRRSGDLAIAVSPIDADRVYVSYASQVGGNYNLFVYKSTDGGATWTGPIQTLTDAKNPALAVNSRGRLAFMYQQVIPCPAGIVAPSCWQTVLRRTSDDFMTPPAEDVLATTPANAPAAVYDPYLGDYLKMVSVRKDFYGVFTANNNPVYHPTAIYKRNKIGMVLHNLMNTPLGVDSIDPFFVEAKEPGFYVADWHNTPADRDQGEEPSTDPTFWDRSDVVNRQEAAPASMTDANGILLSENVRVASLGFNYMFTRVRRNFNLMGPADTATAKFFYASLGTGTNYEPVAPGVASLPFGANVDELTSSPGLEWSLPDTESGHLCVGVEIQSADDAFILPSLAGRSASSAAIDMRRDNNRAQRNHNITPLLALTSGMRWGIVHNALTFRRDILIRYEKVNLPPERLPKVTGRATVTADSVRLRDMMPGESRWIGMELDAPAAGSAGVHFREMEGDQVVNGFSLMTVPALREVVTRATVAEHAGIMARAHALLNIRGAMVERDAAKALLAQPSITDTEYFDLAVRGVAILQSTSDQYPLGAGFDAKNELKLVRLWILLKDGLKLLTAHQRTLAAHDAALTRLNKSRGDVADILQNVIWQLHLLRGARVLFGLPATENLLRTSQEFIGSYAAQPDAKVAYIVRIKEQLSWLRELAVTLPSLAEKVRVIEAALSNPQTLQKAHREYLLEMRRSTLGDHLPGHPGW